jgi:molybdopterin-biosynthesis enzyme MoeA-like protein
MAFAAGAAVAGAAVAGAAVAGAAVGRSAGAAVAGAAVAGAGAAVVAGVPQELRSMAKTITRLRATSTCFFNIFFSFEDIR